MSAMAIANYAFGVNYPLAELSPESLFAFAMYNLYHDVMFPKQNAAHAVTALHQMLPEVFAGSKLATMAMAQPKAKPVKKKAPAKRAKPKVKKTAANKSKPKSDKKSKKPTPTAKKTVKKVTTKKPVRKSIKTTKKKVVAKKK